MIWDFFNQDLRRVWITFNIKVYLVIRGFRRYRVKLVKIICYFLMFSPVKDPKTHTEYTPLFPIG